MKIRQKSLKRLRRFAFITSTPGKVAPKTAGEIVGATVENILEEENF